MIMQTQRQRNRGVRNSIVIEMEMDVVTMKAAMGVCKDERQSEVFSW